MEYRIETLPALQCTGIVKNFGRVTVNEQAGHWTQRRPGIWQFWEDFLDRGENLIIRDKYKLYRAPLWQVGMTQTLENGDTVVSIGAEAREGESTPELTAFEIPAQTWAVFAARGTLNQKEHPVNATMTRALTEWLPTSGYALVKGLELEVYGPGNTQRDDYLAELWLPVRRP